ncbi:MupA/Atu3671 family FMN-dependent luciferase-like monooxygenase [Nocardia niigatensis]
MTGLDFGLFFFGSLPQNTDEHRPYELVIEATKLADELGLGFVSTPERHFDSFGGAFPAPAVLGAALAAVTDRLTIRAGSVITPLHDVLRVVEDWSVVHALSGGRAGISLGSGWAVNDFVLAPADRYVRRKSHMLDDLEAIRRLWHGGGLTRRNAADRPVTVTTFPRPTSSLPIWMTTGGSDESFDLAGHHGCHVLTHLERQSVDVLADRITRYRQARADAGFDPATGIVTLMQHTHLCADDTELAAARTGLQSYLHAALSLENVNVSGGGISSGGSPISIGGSNAHDANQVIEQAVDRYLQGASLIGSEIVCLQRCHRLIAAGVDEIACLVDFMPNNADVLATVRAIAAIAGRLRPHAMEAARAGLTSEFARLRPI